MRRLWPYILPLPLKEQHKLLSAVFGSEVSVKILRLTALSQRVYQRDLIQRLRRYSNKTVIGRLRRLVEAGVLREGMERRVEGERSVWVKWYEPTSIGRWISLLLLPPERVSREGLEGLVTELLKLYVKHAVRLCREYGLDTSRLRAVFEEAVSEKA